MFNKVILHDDDGVLSDNNKEVNLENYVQGKLMQQNVDRTILVSRSTNFFSQRKAKTGQIRSKPKHNISRTDNFSQG